MTGNRNRTDAQLNMDVLAELKYEPSVQITDIGVLVKESRVGRAWGIIGGESAQG
jgi:hypothetical protein